MTDNMESTDCAEQPPETTVEMDVYMSLQQNMFSDVFLQNLGLIIVGQAIAGCPELNVAEKFSATELDGTQNENLGNLRMRTRVVALGESISSVTQSIGCGTGLKRLIAKTNDVMQEEMANAKEDGYKWIARTCRPLIHIEPSLDKRTFEFNLGLVWAEEKMGDS